MKLPVCVSRLYFLAFALSFVTFLLIPADHTLAADYIYGKDSGTGDFVIKDKDTGSVKMRINSTGTLTATGFSGAINSTNISSGAFGENTGGGNFTFSGSVGIGTTAPGAKLEVNGAIKLSSTAGYFIGSSNYGFRFNNSTDAYNNMVLWDSSGLAIGRTYSATDPGAGNIIIQGNVGIGTTNPQAKLDVAGTISGQSGTYLTSLPWFNCGGCAAGYIKLITPIVHNESNMFNIHITEYDYNLGTGREINCYGYAYSGSTLISNGCYSNGDSAIAAEIGVENRGGTNLVVVRLGTPSQGWYYNHFTAEYKGWQAKAASGFSWVTGETTPAQTGNNHNVLINDKGGTITTTGNVGIGTTNPNGSGKLHISGGDNSFAYFGPNSSWGSYLWVGSGPGRPTTSTASVASTNGNLHLDSGSGNDMYLNYYVAGRPIHAYGPLDSSYTITAPTFSGNATTATTLAPSGATSFTTDVSGLHVINAEATGTNVRIGSAWGRAGIYNNPHITIGSENTIYFVTQNVERARIDSANNLYVSSDIKCGACPNWLSTMNSWMNQSVTTTSGPTFGAIHFNGVGGDSGNGLDYYAIYQEGGAWTYPYPDLRIGYHTGIKIGAYYGYNGIRFYNNSDMVTQTMSVGDGDNNVRVAYDLYVGSVGGWMTSYLNQGVRTDSNPTFNQVYVNDWFRVNGAVGIYWQSYAGGWYMQDSTWIRGYNGRSLWMGGGLVGGDGGLTIGYGGVSPPGGGAIIAGNVGIGTTGPGAKLDVAGGSIKVGNTSINSGTIGLGGYPTSISFGNGQFVQDNGGGNMRIYGGANMQLDTSTGPIFLLPGNGNVGIGTTVPNHTLHVNGGLRVTGANVDFDALSSGTGTTAVIGTAGQLKLSSSSIRYKKDVQIYDTDFSKILQAQPKSFTYKDDNMKDIGYIAEDFEALGLKDLLIYNTKGQPDAIKYDKIPVYLIELIKKQQRQIDELKKLVDELEKGYR